MISKEKIENGYIVNDEGELRQKYVDAALHYGFEFHEEACGNISWLDYEHVYFRPSYGICTGGGGGTYGKQELTLADFEPEVVVAESEVKLTHTKESLTGIKVRINGREQWDRLKELCESVGLKHATWFGCDFDNQDTAFVCGYEGRFLATGHWEDTSETSEEFANLREVLYEDLFVVEEEEEEKEQEKGMSIPKNNFRFVEIKNPSIFDLKDKLEAGLLSTIDSHGRTVVMEDEKQLIALLNSKSHLFFREEVKWQDEVEGYLKSKNCLQMANYILNDEDEFLEAARITLKSVGELK